MPPNDTLQLLELNDGSVQLVFNGPYAMTVALTIPSTMVDQLGAKGVMRLFRSGRG